MTCRLLTSMWHHVISVPGITGPGPLVYYKAILIAFIYNLISVRTIVRRRTKIPHYQKEPKSFDA